MHEFSILSGPLLFLAAAGLCAQNSGPLTQQIVPLPVKNLKSDNKAEKVDNNGMITLISRPSFVVYPAPKSNKKHAGIIICPGGGYQLLDYRSHVERVAPIFNKAGITVFGLKYRLDPPSKNAPLDALADLTCAIQVIRARAAEWNVDPQHLGVLGYSAGSNCILNLLCVSDSQGQIGARPDFVVLLCPWPKGGNPEDFSFPKSTPPIYIAQAEDDDTAPASFAKGLKQQLDSMGIKTELRLVPHGGHLAFNYKVPTGEPDVPWTGEVVSWLEKNGLLNSGK
jgi:acetyl esterase/lipase